MIDRVRESRNPKKVIRVTLMESYGEIGRVPVNLSEIILLIPAIRAHIFKTLDFLSFLCRFFLSSFAYRKVCPKVCFPGTRMLY